MKILILGIGQSNFLNQLYGNIKLKDDSFVFEIDGYRDISKGNVLDENQIYQKKINLKNISVKKSNKTIKVFSLIKLAFSSFFWKVVFFELKIGSKLLDIVYKLLHHIHLKYIVKQYILPEKYDIYHFHFCTPENLLLASFLPKKSKIIMSFWGSDLFRRSGKSNYFYVRQALLKATRITVQSPEMAQYLGDKYGNDLLNKVKDIRFTISTKIYNSIDFFKDKKNEIVLFKEKYGMEKEDIVIALGHNSFKENNHIQMIEKIREIPKDLKKNISFLIHLGYGGDKEYIDELKGIIEKEKDAKYIVIDEYFKPKEIAKLRIITTIMLQLPISDALSGAMTEVMYAGNIVIAGKWLPYDILQRKGIKFYEMDNFNELPSLILATISNLKKDRLSFSNNRDIIRAFLFPDVTTHDWIALFNTVNNISFL